MQDEYEYYCAENVQRLSLLLSINMEFLLTHLRRKMFWKTADLHD